jgi:hypothetical protein
MVLEDRHEPGEPIPRFEDDPHPPVVRELAFEWREPFEGGLTDHGVWTLEGPDGWYFLHRVEWAPFERTDEEWFGEEWVIGPFPTAEEACRVVWERNRGARL